MPETFPHMKHDVRPAKVQPNSWMAKGITKALDDVPVWLAPLLETCRPCVMRNSPDVITIDRGCINHGYAFY